jgi:hypothetical protein
MQGDTGALEFLVDVGKVRKPVGGCYAATRAVQPGLKLIVAEGLGHGPVDAGHTGQRHVLADHALGYLEARPTSL